MLNNERQLGNTPWTYYDYIFQLPVAEQQTFANFARYENQAQAVGLDARAEQGADVERGEGEEDPLADPEVHLEELPAIPLWYNGLWAQYNTSVWTNSRRVGYGAADHARDVERLPQHDGHRSARQVEEEELGGITNAVTVEPLLLRSGSTSACPVRQDLAAEGYQHTPPCAVTSPARASSTS